MADEQRLWAVGGTDLLRGVGGGVIVGLPLLYTMEMWFIGMYVSDWLIAGSLLFAFVVNVGLNHASGFSEQHTLWSDLSDSVIALGVSFVLSAVVLSLLDTINLYMSFTTVAGMVALCAVPVSIGFSVANTHFGGGSRGGEMGDQRSDEDEEKRKAMVDLIDIGITIAGATIFVFAVAPTEEIKLIAARTTGWHWAGLVAFSMLLTYAIVFVADFSRGGCRRGSEGLLQRPVPETVLAYILSVATGLLLLFLLGRIEVFASVSQVVANGAVIGLPAAVGGAAGRLVV